MGEKAYRPNFYDMRDLFENLETAKIYANAEIGRLCNDKQYIDACVFQSIRDSVEQNIQLLQSYLKCKTEREEENE